jgi:two-component system, chemotaxis family, chemotaxis protein CheY
MSARILIVDDSASMRALHVYHLQSAGYETVEADSGFNALETLQEGHCDLALVDVNMPGMDGFTLTRHIRADATTRDMPIILCTTLQKEGDRQQGMDAGADAYLIKPPDPEILLESVHGLLGD